MKKLALSSLVLGSLVGLGLNVNAEQTIVGENEATIEVNGTLGVNNTDPEAPINEGSDEWINVTVPTQTIFYGVGKKADSPIESPNYTITNKSGRPVDVSVSKFAVNGTDQFGEAKLNLNLNVNGSNKANLITSGVVLGEQSSDLATLANSEGKLTKEGQTGDQELTFNYSGTYDGTVVKTAMTSSYNLTLKFKAVEFK